MCYIAYANAVQSNTHKYMFMYINNVAEHDVSWSNVEIR